MIPYYISDSQPEFEHNNHKDNTENTNIDKNKQLVKKQQVHYLTVPSIPHISDVTLDASSIQTGGPFPETMDLRPLIEVPYTPNHPDKSKYKSNIEIVARQLECMAQLNGTWKGRASRLFWDKVSSQSLNSIRDIYNCVKQYGMLPYSLESTIDKSSTKISARSHRLLIVKPISRNIELI